MKKKLLSMICAICTIFMLLPTAIFADTYEDFEYSISEETNEVTITKYTGTDTVVSIPDTINGNPVTSIGTGAFAGRDNLENITIPNGVTSIGSHAFDRCGFTSITIPNNVTSIGNAAFRECSKLQSIFLPIGLNVVYDSVHIISRATKVRYSLDSGKVTITSIDLGYGKSSVDLPAAICGYPVVGISDENLLSNINNHTHYYNWTEINGKYQGECGICKEKTQEQTVPTIVINAPDQVCRTQDTVVSVTLPEGLTNATLYHEFSHSGGEIDLDASDGLNGKVSHESYPGEENGLKFVVYAKTSDGFEFTVTKTVEILDNHILEHISAKDATASKEGNIEYWHCTVCDIYFLDKDGKNEIELKDTVVSRKAPEIIEGKGQSVNQGEKKALSFTSNAPYNEFKYVKLDGKVLDYNNYTVKEGSTIVTLNKDFVSTLKAGKHTIGIVSETGEASVEFNVNKKTSIVKPSKNTTNTGLVSNIGLWISLMFTSLEAMGIGLICRKKYKK